MTELQPPGGPGSGGRSSVMAVRREEGPLSGFALTSRVVTRGSGRRWVVA